MAPCVGTSIFINFDFFESVSVEQSRFVNRLSLLMRSKIAELKVHVQGGLLLELKRYNILCFTIYFFNFIKRYSSCSPKTSRISKKLS
ncbi:hypothetical protein L3Y34_011370 [Caenorhabditis briggsae]|uniref:Uncharacterized protein n=1 Tax=Caenorhabditis briggsae TaxID=6238 RepID=A0AAE8ZSQ3_CAEBR|nr:hypothetical protein L3Y34_011370 [Caenorhabditis briggsae]